MRIGFERLTAETIQRSRFTRDPPYPPPNPRLLSFPVLRQCLAWFAFVAPLLVLRRRSSLLLRSGPGGRASSLRSGLRQTDWLYSFRRLEARNRAQAQTSTFFPDEYFRWQPCPARPAGQPRDR